MRYLIFSHDSNPAIDPPAYKLSGARGEELLHNDEAFAVGPRHLQMRPPAGYVREIEKLASLPEDWIRRQVSRLPGGERLVITTLQLLTPSPAQ